MTSQPDPSSSLRQPRTRRGRETQQAILHAAEAVIGARGYGAASIGMITTAAGIAQGTFYIYFESKEDVFRALVAEMGRVTRQALAEAVAEAPDRLSAERQGLRAFLDIAARRPTLYSIVNEARFIDPDAFSGYFATFARSYAQNLAAAAREGEIREGDAEIRAWALMGMAITLGERFGQTPAEARERVVDEVFDMLEKGLRP